MINIKGNREFVKWWNYWMERIHSSGQASTLRDSPAPPEQEAERAPTGPVEVRRLRRRLHSNEAS